MPSIPALSYNKYVLSAHFGLPTNAFKQVLKASALSQHRRSYLVIDQLNARPRQILAHPSLEQKLLCGQHHRWVLPNVGPQSFEEVGQFPSSREA